MKKKSIIFLFALIFMITFSLGSVSAEDLQTTDSGEVSGDVDVTCENPWSTSGELNYEIPENAKDIKSAQLYVNVYSGSAQNTYGANANISLKTDNGEKQIASEKLWTEEGSTDGTIYKVNDHINKCYSDYQLNYDITDSLKGLNGSSVVLKVDTFKMDDKNFDGRIKLIALVLAYDDGDDDNISYWINSGQAWTKTNTTASFSTQSLSDVVNATLINVALSTSDASFRLNSEFLSDADVHVSGNYYKYNQWDVTGKLTEGKDTEFLSVYAGTSAYGSLKNVLSILKAQSEVISADVTFSTEYTSVSTCYAGTNNTLTIKTSSNKAGKYTVELLADGKVINSTEISLDGQNTQTVLLTDPTLRELDSTTVNGAVNNKVNYTVNLKYNNETVGHETKTVPVLYNGNLGKDMAYNATYMEDFKNITVSGDVVVDIKDVSSYLSAASTGRTDIWTINLDNSSKLVNAFVYVSYNWDKSGNGGPVFTASFNDANITSDRHYRDQSNLGNYGQYGYGMFVYDVSDLIKNGENKFTLNKISGMTAVYPSALVYLYNSTDSQSVKTVYFADGADLLASSNNVAGRTVISQYILNTDCDSIADGQLYVFAASPQTNEGNIIFNGEEYINVWSGSSSSVELFKTDITDKITDKNNISFVATGSTILALQQMIVTTKNIKESSITILSVNGNSQITGVLKDENGNPIANAAVAYTVSQNISGNATTDENGKFTIQANSTGEVIIKFEGNEALKTTKASITLENISSQRIATVIEADSTFTRTANDYSAGERGDYFKARLLDINGNPIANVTCFIAVNGPIYNATTDENGYFGIPVNLAAANTYTYAVSFLGNDKYEASLNSSKLILTAKKTSISASAKTFKASAKTKTVSVTLKTVKNQYNGKTYLKKGKKITLTVNGKKFTAKTNAKGVAKFNIKLTKKGKYTAKIKFGGDKTYKASSKSIKITIK